MQKALLLIKSKTQNDFGLLNKIKNYPGVVEANIIYGPYDIYSICQNTSTMGIKKLVLDIRNFSGVVSTMTCLISE